MEELLALEEYKPRGVKRGSVIEGTILSISPVEVLVDISGKSEGIISGRELGDSASDLKVGGKILAYVLQSEDESGQTILSLRRAGGEKRWREVEKLFTEGATIPVRGLETNRGGLVVDLDGVRGFIPSSQLDQPYSGAQGIGKEFQAKIIELDRKANRLILSQKSLTAETNRKRFEGAAKKFKVGESYTGKISGVMPYGLFVALEEGVEGLVHISEVSWERVASLTEDYKLGDEVEVKVLSIDPSAGRINLSIRALSPDPWKDKIEKLKPGERVQGEVIKLTQFGVFVKLEQGVDGLVRSAKIPEYMVDIKPGLKLDLVVEEIKPEARRISLAVAEDDKVELKPIEELTPSAFEVKAEEPEVTKKAPKKKT